jgi:hypothetical protein
MLLDVGRVIGVGSSLSPVTTVYPFAAFSTDTFALYPEIEVMAFSKSISPGILSANLREWALINKKFVKISINSRTHFDFEKTIK